MTHPDLSSFTQEQQDKIKLVTSRVNEINSLSADLSELGIALEFDTLTRVSIQSGEWTTLKVDAVIRRKIA